VKKNPLTHVQEILQHHTRLRISVHLTTSWQGSSSWQQGRLEEQATGPLTQTTPMSQLEEDHDPVQIPDTELDLIEDQDCSNWEQKILQTPSDLRNGASTMPLLPATTQRTKI